MELICVSGNIYFEQKTEQLVCHACDLQTLYKTQVKELREEVEEKMKQVQEMDSEIQQRHEER